MSKSKIILDVKLMHDLKNNMFFGFTILAETWGCFYSKIKGWESKVIQSLFNSFKRNYLFFNQKRSIIK